jgi:hypothetical protein
MNLKILICEIEYGLWHRSCSYNLVPYAWRTDNQKPVNPVPPTYAEGFGSVPFGDIRKRASRHSCAEHCVWYGVNFGGDLITATGTRWVGSVAVSTLENI